MQRTPEPELMDDPAQALAYARADFEQPHNQFIAEFRRVLPDVRPRQVLDLGCGPGDICRRFALAFPDCHILGVDGAAAMIGIGRDDIARAGLSQRVTLQQGYLPGGDMASDFDTTISNSLLHHLRDPQVLWQTVHAHTAPGGVVFIMDLMRPPDDTVARALVETYAAGEPEILRQDFHHSLHAAYTPAEVREQLREADLGRLTVEVISDRHWIAHGRL